LEHLAESFDNEQAQLMADTLNTATEKFLEMNRSPSRKVNELDNRGSHFYLAMYWAEALAAQDVDAALKARFGALAAELSENEEKIAAELLDVQGTAMDIGGYYQPDTALTSAAMRPSRTFNGLLAAL
jgi:isocitrate dehydrogenase